MALNKLKATEIFSKKYDGKTRVSDGGNLYLRISPTNVRSWVFMYAIGGGDGKRGRQYELGLGPAHTVTLAEARIKAADLRKMLIDGKNPALERERARAISQKESKSFDDVFQAFIRDNRAEWDNGKHAAQWESTIYTYAYPFIERRAINDIEPSDIKDLLIPIWETKTETATRLRQRIERVFDYAIAHKYRRGENPARWKGGALSSMLPKPGKVAKKGHFAALGYREIGDFIANLRKQEGVAPRMLELAILCVNRSNEVRGVRWGEIDLDLKMWTVPADRMKMKVEHRVPLSAQALRILNKVREEQADSNGVVDPNALVFPSPTGKVFSDAAMTAVLRRMKVDVTQHGFRSTFRDWAADTTNFPREVCETALAHKVANETEAAYWRSDVFDKRVKLMNAWGVYCDTPKKDGTEKVVPFGKKGKAAA